MDGVFDEVIMSGVGVRGGGTQIGGGGGAIVFCSV